MTDPIEFVRDGYKLRLVVSKVLDPSYWVVNEVRLANPDDLRAAGWVPASEADWAETNTCLRRINAALGLSLTAPWEEAVAEAEGRDVNYRNALASADGMKQQRDAALQRVRELEERHRKIVDGCALLTKERDDLRQKLEQAELDLELSREAGAITLRERGELNARLTAAEKRATEAEAEALFVAERVAALESKLADVDTLRQTLWETVQGSRK